MRIMRKEARKGKKEREKEVRWGTKGIEGECVPGNEGGREEISKERMKGGLRSLYMRLGR